MDHSFQPAVDPRKQELLEARFLGARVSDTRQEQKKLFFPIFRLPFDTTRYYLNIHIFVCTYSIA